MKTTVRNYRHANEHRIVSFRLPGLLSCNPYFRNVPVDRVCKPFGYYKRCSTVGRDVSGLWVVSMSFQYLDAAWESDCKHPVAKLVLVSLADHANQNGGCFPSVARLSRRCNLSRRSVQRHLRALESLGFIKSNHRIGTSSDYSLTLRQTDAPHASIRRTRLRQPDAGGCVTETPKPSVEPKVKPKGESLSPAERISLEKELERNEAEIKKIQDFRGDFYTPEQRERIRWLKDRNTKIRAKLFIEL